MELPTEFLTLADVLTIGGMGVVLFFIVQATKDLPIVQKIPTLLYAWILGAVLLFVGTVLKAGAEVNWGEAAYMSVVNGILVAGVAVLAHQGLTRARILKEGDD